MKSRVYADTSVFGGCFDNEFTEHSSELIENFKTGEKILTISDLTLQELENALQEVKDIYKSIPTEFIEFLTLDEEAKFLATKYIEERTISQKSLVDAQHIAIASIKQVDVLVSWNFRHIVNLRRIQLYKCYKSKIWLSIN